MALSKQRQESTVLDGKMVIVLRRSIVVFKLRTLFRHDDNHHRLGGLLRHLGLPHRGGLHHHCYGGGGKRTGVMGP